MTYNPSRDRDEKQMTVHGPTQRYYYIKMKQAERIFMQFIKINPANPDKKILMDMWDEAQNYLSPKSTNLTSYKANMTDES
jgi:hypothetical protein